MAIGNVPIMAIEVAYASPVRGWLIPLNVEAGTSIARAIMSSGILEQCPEIDLEINKVGIFGNIAELDTLLRVGDRVEIYRPLVLDPKAARRLRADQANGDR